MNLTHEATEGFVETIALLEDQEAYEQDEAFFRECYDLLDPMVEAVYNAEYDGDDATGVERQAREAMEENPERFGNTLAMKATGANASFDEAYPKRVASQFHELARHAKINGNIQPQENQDGYSLEIGKM